MRNVVLTVEDLGQRSFFAAVVERVGREFSVPVRIRDYSVEGGKGRVWSSLQQLVKDLERQQASLPDALIIGLDANCSGYNQIRKKLDDLLLDKFKPFAVYAVPDPHVERWMLIDSHAFADVFGVGCQAPNLKCDKGKYKSVLNDAIAQSGIRPALGGMEFASDLVEAMNLQDAARQDVSFKRFLDQLRDKFQEWTR